jgi:hypothetical protein
LTNGTQTALAQPASARNNPSKQHVVMKFLPASRVQPEELALEQEHHTESIHKTSLRELQSTSTAGGGVLHASAPLDLQVQGSTHSGIKTGGSNLPTGAAIQEQNAPQQVEVEAQTHHRNHVHGCCLPLSTVRSRICRLSPQSELVYHFGSLGTPDKFSALDAYNKAKKFGPRLHSSPASPCYMPPHMAPLNHCVSHSVETQQLHRPRSLSPSSMQRPLRRVGSLSKPGAIHQDVLARGSVFDRVHLAGLQTKNSDAKSHCKENERALSCSKEVYQEYSSSESPVFSRGLDIWRCSALETALHQVEKTLGATRRVQSCKAKTADTAATSVGEKRQSAQGTMSSILQRMRQGSAREHLIVGNSHKLITQRSNSQKKRIPSQERGGSKSGARRATGQPLSQRSSRAAGRSQIVHASRPNFACDVAERAVQQEHHCRRQSSRGARVRCVSRASCCSFAWTAHQHWKRF